MIRVEVHRTKKGLLMEAQYIYTYIKAKQIYVVTDV